MIRVKREYLNLKEKNSQRGYSTQTQNRMTTKYITFIRPNKVLGGVSLIGNICFVYLAFNFDFN